MTDSKGVQTKKWLDLYAKLINDTGGLQNGNEKYQVKIITYDTKGNAVTAKDLLAKLVLSDGVKFIIGENYVTGSVDVDITITEPNHVIVIGSDVGSTAADPKNQYYYTTGSYFMGAMAYQICKDMVNKGVKSYVSLKPDTDLGHFADPQIDTAWKIADPNINKLGTVYVAPGTLDFGPVATKVMSYHPDCVDMLYLGMITGSIPQMYRALADAGYKGILLPGIMAPNDLDNLVTTVGKEFVEGGEVFTQDPTGFQTDPRMLSFLDGYVKEYGKFEVDALQALDMMFVLEDAIKSARSVDVEDVKNYLDNSTKSIHTIDGYCKLYARPDLGNYRTICGALTFPTAKITDGKLVPFSMVTLKDEYLYTIISNNLVDTYKAYWAKYGYPVFPEDEKTKNTLSYADLGITGQD
jgi:ABC-type branched-subunit amino acid transport system substrate-binding protein